MKPVLDKYTSSTLSPKILRWIKLTLTNDEDSSNRDLVNYFLKSEPSLTKEEAELWVSRRSFYIRNIVILETTEEQVQEFADSLKEECTLKMTREWFHTLREYLEDSCDEHNSNQANELIKMLNDSVVK